MYFCAVDFLKVVIMIISVENITIEDSLKDTLERIKITRRERKKPNLAQFFGVLPNFDDGLEFQKAARNEWN